MFENSIRVIDFFWQTKLFSILALMFGMILAGCQPVSGEPASNQIGEQEPTGSSNPSDSDKNDQIMATLALSKANATPAELLAAVRKAYASDDELVRSAGNILVARNSNAIVGELGPLFDSDDDAELEVACSIVSIIGPEAKNWLPKFKRILGELYKERQSLQSRIGDDIQMKIKLAPEVALHSGKQRMILFALRGMGPAAIELLPELNILLSDENFNLQVGACQVLETIGPNVMEHELGEEISSKLLTLMKSGNISTKGWSAIATGAIYSDEKSRLADPEGFEQAKELLVAKLSAFTQPEKQRALLGIAHLGPAAKPMLDEVERLRSDRSKNVVPHAIYALYKIKGDDPQNVKSLVKLLGSSSYQSDAMMFLGEMGESAKPALDPICDKLESLEAGVREEALVVLTRLGKHAASVAERVKPLLEDEDLLVRAAAEDFLARLEKSTTEK